MKIERVSINGFGKLNDREFTFSDGINIIYGENERGKSTLHNFMESMLYHSYKTGVLKRAESKILAKYNPWGISKYSGNMTIFDEDRRTIEKDFSKSKNVKISVFDETGQDRIDDYEIDLIAREPKIGFKHLGLTKVMFRNTVSISQMGKGTDAEVVDEIKKYVSNVEKANDSTISVQDVLKKLSKRKNEIGRKTLSKSNYAIREKRIKKLDKELKEAKEIANEIDSLQVESLDIKIEKEKLENKLDSISKRLDDIETFENNELKKKADELMHKINESDKELVHLKNYEKFTYDKITDLRNAINDLEKGEITLDATKGELDSLERQRDELIGKTNFDSNIYELFDIKDAIKKNILRIRGLEGANAEIEKELLESVSKSAELKEETEPNKTLALLVLFITLLIGFGLMFVNNYLGIAIIVIAVSFAYFYWTRRKEKYELYKVKHKKDKEDLENLENTLFDNSKEIKDILANYECEEIEVLEEKLDDISSKIAVLSSKADEAKRNREKKEALDSQIRKKQLDFDELNKNLVSTYELRDEIFNELGVDSFESTEEGFRKYNEYDDTKKTNENLKERIKELLLGKNYEDLEYKELSAKVNLEDKEGLLSEKELISKRFIENSKKEEGINSKINALERGNRSIQSYEEEIEGLKAEKEIDDKKIKVISLLEDKINATIDTVQRTVMPDVNMRMCEIVSDVTEGKYDDIKVSGDLNLYVIDKENNKTVEIESLSAGTIDLIYVGLRIGMAAMFNADKSVPIFFDDTFAQIDENRLKSLLKYLSALDRQIFIFTCHKRESFILEDLGVDHKLINM